MLMFEVTRRAFFISETTPEEEKNPFMNRFGKVVLPKPSQWSREKLITWLKDNLLMWKLSDMAYMKKQISQYKTSLTNTLRRKKHQLQLDESIWGRSGWDGIVPNVRLIQIITSDELKNSFIHRNDIDSRLELDARGTESARVSFFEKVRLKFNDDNYFVTSEVLDPTWGGQVFLDAHPCNWEQLEMLNISRISDEQSCKRYFMKMNNTLGTVHRRWSQSGNGDEQLINTANDSTEVQGGDKLDFLHSKNISCMYMWSSLLKGELFDHSESDLHDDLKPMEKHQI